MEKLDIIVETINGLHITLATVYDEVHGAEIAHALYQYYCIPRQNNTIHIRHLWLRSSTVNPSQSEPQNKHLLRAWPEAWQDEAGHKASIAAWKASPRGVSGDESEPDEKTATQAIQAELAKLPKRYDPRELTCKSGRYTLSIDYTRICIDMPAREAIQQVRNYVEAHERANWSMPTGVVNGIYD